MGAFNLFDLLDQLRGHWLRFALWGAGFALAGYLVTFLIPPIYEAHAVILPPDDDELASAFSMQRRSLGGLGALSRLGAGSYFTQADLTLATLRSRSLRERVIREYDLQKVYREKSLEATDRRFDSNMRVQIGTDGTIAVVVRDQSPKRAADMANALFTGLDEINRVFRTARARRTRIFLEQRVAQTDSTLRVAEGMLTRYQGRHGAVVLPPDPSGGTEAGASLLAEELRAEVQLSMVGSYASPTSQEYQRARQQVEELRRQIGRFPATQAGASEIVRQVAVQQQVLALLTSQLEDARIREVMDTPTIQILDWARPPDRRAWPRRTLIMAFGFVVGLALAALLGLRRGERVPVTP